MVPTAVILAAGQGSRLRSAQLDIPKCLIPVGGRPLIEHQLATIEALGIRDVVVIVGYKRDLVMRHLGTRVRFRVCETWSSSNNFLTLWDVRDELAGGFLCFFADVYCDADPIERALRAPSDICVIVDTARVLAGTMRVRLNGARVTGIGSHISVAEGAGNFIGIAKCSAAGAARMIGQMDTLRATSRQDYYTVAIDRLADRGEAVGYVDVHGRPWVEVDTADDLERARALLGNGEAS